LDEEACYEVSSAANDTDDGEVPNMLPRTMKGASIAKPVEVPERVLSNEVSIYTLHPALADEIEQIVRNFQQCWIDCWGVKVGFSELYIREPWSALRGSIDGGAWTGGCMRYFEMKKRGL